jgi:hypothetical protein
MSVRRLEHEASQDRDRVDDRERAKMASWIAWIKSTNGLPAGFEYVRG